MSYAIEHVTNHNAVCERCKKFILGFENATVYERRGTYPSVQFGDIAPINITINLCRSAGPSGYPRDAFSTAEDFYPGGPIIGGVKPRGA